MTHVVLIGNPNCGKTTLFNALTGDSQHVGNWPGVTVEKKTGACVLGAQKVEITDLPGIYSLVADSQTLSEDERIATHVIMTLDAQCIINVVDACHLERHLYLTSQILELGTPTIVALNMMDIAHQRGIVIDVAALSAQLGCPVIPITAHKHQGISELLHALIHTATTQSPLILTLPQEAQAVLQTLEQQLIAQGYTPPRAFFYARRLLEGESHVALEAINVHAVSRDNQVLGLDMILADARYQKIHDIVSAVQQKRSDASEHFTAKCDRWVLNRFLALPLFFTMMYLMFLFAINVGGVFQDFFDISTDTVFVQGSAWFLEQYHAPHWLIAIVAYGIGKGINTTLTFIPVIAAMFFFLSVLEASGYMARAAFVMDKLMQILGLPGKAFVPMIVGFGCNVPAIMAARTLDSERERMLTVMMSPFMSCSARLTIYAVFVAAFFPEGGQNIVFLLYLMGIAMAVFTGFLLRKTLLKGHASPLILELPAYHRPSLKRLMKATSLRLRFFVVRAGRLIIPMCVLLGGLNAMTFHGGISAAQVSNDSILSWMGQLVTPLFAPIGIHQDNWPATVGLLTGLLAKEVVVGSLNSLYSQMGHWAQASISTFDFWHGMHMAWSSIPEHIAQLGASIHNPIAASASNEMLSKSAYGTMVLYFDGKIGAFAYLLFVLLYIPCVSTIAVIRQETNKKLMWVSVLWSLIIAYATSVLFYQTAKLLEHPQVSILWIVTMAFVLMATIGIFHYTHAGLRGQNAAQAT